MNQFKQKIIKEVKKEMPSPQLLKLYPHIYGERRNIVNYIINRIKKIQ